LTVRRLTISSTFETPFGDEVDVAGFPSYFRARLIKRGHQLPIRCHHFNGCVLTFGVGSCICRLTSSMGLRRGLDDDWSADPNLSAAIRAESDNTYKKSSTYNEHRTLGGEQVSKTKLPGVILSNNFHFNTHILTSFLRSATNDCI
jgi:hypothetical protein